MHWSARRIMVALTVAVVLLPLVLLLIAWLYERVLIAADLNRFSQLASRAAQAPPEHWARLARAERVWLRQVARDGSVSFDSGNATEAQGFSWLGELFERGLQMLGAASSTDSLVAIDAQFGPLSERREIVRARESSPSGMSRASEGGQSVVVSWAHPGGDGSVLLIEHANHRGVRQLLLARNQLAKLMLVQLVVALSLAWVLSRQVVAPLEQLAEGARAFPMRALAQGRLLARADEFGVLARAFNELAQSLEMRRAQTVQLAGDLAHELKNPLATIEAASEFMASTRDPTPQKREELHQVIHAAVERLERTTETLVAEVRFETALAEAPREQVPLRPWLESLLGSYRADPRHHEWAFALSIAPGAETMTVVPEAWARLLRNLIDNARVQPSAKKEIRVEVHRTPEALVIDVVDFGPGVSAGNRDKIFRRFFTARPEGTPPGSGLGLSVAQSIALAHQGSLTLLDPTPGRGAIFRITLPH